MDQRNRVKLGVRALDWDWVRYILAFVLIAAGTLKAWQFAYAPLETGGKFAVLFSIAVVEFELAFALMLFFGLRPRVMKWAAGCLFALFGVISLYKAITGEASCGCFGELRVSPWWTSVLDAAIVLAVLFSRVPTPSTPVNQEGSEKTKTAAHDRWLVKVFISSVVTALVLGSQILLFYSPMVGIESLINSGALAFSIDDSVKDSDGKSVSIVITNRGDQPITIQGAGGNCASGGVIDGLPVCIQAGTAANIVYRATDMKHSQSRSRQSQRFSLYIDCRGTKRFVVRMPLYKHITKSVRADGSNPDGA